MNLSSVMFYIWCAAMILAVWAFNLAQRFGLRLPRLARRDLAEATLRSVVVIVPIKGVDDDTSENIRLLLEQDYPDYRVIFTVESNDDPVVPLLEKIAIENSKIEIVIAGLAETRGQKVHNQLAAVERTTHEDEVLVFMDADAKPIGPWLRGLVTPLMFGPRMGATTGYRYYIPVTAHRANRIVSILNAQVASLLGPFRRNFAWGGSMAIRRKNFFEYGLHDLWQGALSDDYVLSHCVKTLNKKRIGFVPQCLVASDANFNWASLFEFAVRQYRITKVCAPRIWFTALVGALLYLVAFAYTLFNSLYGFIRPTAFHGHEHINQILMFAALYALSSLRGYLLVLGGKRMLPEHRDAIASTLFTATIGMPWCFVINLIALLGSAVGRNIVWRGVAYQMKSRTQTILQRPHVNAPTRHIASVRIHDKK